MARPPACLTLIERHSSGCQAYKISNGLYPKRSQFSVTFVIGEGRGGDNLIFKQFL
jgi:hypothetical protein